MAIRKNRVQKGVPKRPFPYLIDWFCDTHNATEPEIPKLYSKTPRAWLLGETDDISHILIHDLYDPVEYTLKPSGEIQLTQRRTSNKSNDTLALRVTPQKSMPAMY